MGLDNIPKNYPCQTQETAVLDEDERIDCQATQACGGCPWKNDREKAGITEGAVYGIFGTSCWYRGKYGNYMLEQVTEADKMGDDLNFYGDNVDGTEKSPESCVQLADLIATVLISYETNKESLDEEARDLAGNLRYAEWYLRWAAEKCDGLVCWY